MQDNYPGRVEDFTAASLVLLFVNMLWIFTWIWSSLGLFPVLLLGLLINHLITRLDLARRRRDARYAATRDRITEH